MTQRSRPNAENKNDTPSYTDSGPYIRDEWAEKLIVEWVGDNVTTRGPFAQYLNRLEVTNPVGTTIQVDTGAGYVNGTLLFNDVALSFAPSAPVANPRIDRVVLVFNNTNAAYNTNLEFPADLTDYAGAASVPPYRARLAILTGAEAGAPVPRALVQNANYYMVELAQYQISVVPAISNLTDYRDYVDAKTRYIFVPCFYGRNLTDSLDKAPEAYLPGGVFSAASPVIWMVDNKTTSCFARTQFPSDYIRDMTVQGVILNTGGISGDMSGELRWRAGGCGEVFNLANDRTNTVVETINPTNLYYSCHYALAVTGVSEDQILHLEFDRFGADGTDTINDDVAFMGFLIEYLGVR